ncbi:hypothetical protein NDU88_003811 [Pleurodeles waltl]|uniref:Uncharacterized protein n=1 Tax=Pleurodeles waltl TaxID=8319 RepID=A0AAV7VID9_PLEWA|nr:hypothetical protein NDU88_003811 [Pleurodeles waltl]
MSPHRHLGARVIFQYTTSHRAYVLRRQASTHPRACWRHRRRSRNAERGIGLGLTLAGTVGPASGCRRGGWHCLEWQTIATDHVGTPPSEAEHDRPCAQGPPSDEHEQHQSRVA